LSNDDTAPTRRQSKPAPQRSKATRYVGRKSGPARKPRLIKQEIFRIFKAADALLSNRSAPERTKFIAAHWSGAIEIDGKAILAPSKNTVERYWVEWKDKLAEQGKSELDQ
jgi:hypothetical protein